jgi:peptide-methionine (R)-S-oxide reductase
VRPGILKRLVIGRGTWAAAPRRSVGDMKRTDMKNTEPEPSVLKSDAQWREQLTPAEYAVLRKAATEPAFTGELTDNKRTGIYRCRACGSELFRSDAKFESHCGWPSFFTPLAGDSVIERRDVSGFMVRTEVVCANCHSHLGHVFEGEGYGTPTDQRYCINSISLTFDEA